LRLFSFGGYGLALAALALVVFCCYRLPPSPVSKAVTNFGVPDFFRSAVTDWRLRRSTVVFFFGAYDSYPAVYCCCSAGMELKTSFCLGPLLEEEQSDIKRLLHRR